MLILINYLLHLIIILLIALLLIRSFNKKIKYILAVGLIIKLLSGIVYGLFYLNYAGYGDTLSYFTEGKKLSSLAREDFLIYIKYFLNIIPSENIFLKYSEALQPRAFWMVKATSLFLLITNDNYWITCGYLSLISFIGITFLVKALFKVYPSSKLEILASFLFLPSFVFWSSGLSKESIAIASLFFLSGISLIVYINIRLSFVQILLSIACIWIVYKLRFFYLAIWLATFGMLAVVVFVKRVIEKKIFQLGLLIGGAFIIGFIIFNLDYHTHPFNILTSLFQTYQANYSDNPSNAIDFYRYDNSITGFLINFPIALFSGLFRPSLFDVQKPLMVLVSVENGLLLLILLTKIPYLKRKPSLIEFCIWSYVLILALFLAFASPNFGSLTRYKVAYLPFFLFLLIKDHPILKKLSLRFNRSIE